MAPGGGGTLRQLKYRGRYDNGSETTASWVAAVNTDWDQVPDTTFRVRFEIYDSSAGSQTHATKFQYNLNSAGWTDITSGSSVVKAVDSSYVTNGEATTQQLGTATFLAGEETEDGLTETVAFVSGTSSEHELVCQIISSDVSVSDSIGIRSLKADGTAYTYDVNCTVTVDSIEPLGEGGSASRTSNFSTFAIDSSVGTVNLMTAGSAQTSDDQYCQLADPHPIAGSSYQTYYLKCTDLISKIPSGTINGIEITIEKAAAVKDFVGNVYCLDYHVYIVSGGTILTTEDKKSSNLWETTDTDQPYGGMSDLWSQSWDYSDINDSGFGVVIAMDVYGDGTGEGGDAEPTIDWVRATIYYTTAIDASRYGDFFHVF